MSGSKEDPRCMDTAEKAEKTPSELRKNVESLNTNVSINDVIDRFSCQLGEVKELTTNRDNLSTYELLEKASGGLALKGIFVTKSPEECIDLRKTVIERPRDTVLKSPVSSQKDHVVEFSSKAEADHFCRSLETMGHSITASVKGGQFYFQAEAGLSFHECEVLTTEHEPYLTRVLYSYVPTAVCELDREKLRFDDSALQQLKKIDLLLYESGNDSLVQKKCECFIKDYGSHVNVGIIEFGGIYQWKATFSGEASHADNMSPTTDVVGEDLGGPSPTSSAVAGGILSGHLSVEDEVAAHAALVHAGDDMQQSNLTMNVIKKGGPQEATSLSLWKEGLIKHNNTWAVIDRGSNFAKDFIGIWEIVANSEREFTDASKLASILHGTWQMLNGMVADLPSKPNARESAWTSLTEFLKRTVSSWILDEDLTNNAPEYLETLDEKVKEYYLATEGDALMPSKLRHQQILTDFLMKIMRIKRQYTPSQLRKVQGILKELVKTAKGDFPLRDDILQFVEFRKVTRETVLNQLGLGDYYPSKITLQDVMAVQKRTHDMINLPWLILQKLVMLDYKCRENDLSMVSAKDTNNTSAESKEEVMFEDFMKMITSEIGCTSTLNPLDVFLSIYTCCDMILKQIVVNKLFLCRLAVPFIFPQNIEDDHLLFSLWALRNIVVNWKNKDGTQMETSVVSQPVKSVTFLQLGESSQSQSALLNSVISDQPHHTFWNRECLLGESEIQLADGLVEAQWYLPKGKSDDAFDLVTMFLNLRGNATDHKRQVGMLQKMSNIIVCFLSTVDLNDPEVCETMKTIHDNTATVVILLSNQEKNIQVLREQIDGYFSFVGDHHKATTKLVSSMRGNRQRTKDDLKQELRQILQEALLPQIGKSVEDSSNEARDYGLQVDEDEEFCKKAKSLADQVMSCMENKTASTCKLEMLPLQSHDWDMLLKAAKSAAAPGSVHDMAKIEEEKQKLQQDKLQACNKLSQTIETFLRNLIEAADSPVALLYLQWLKIYFNEMCRTTLPNLHEQYHCKWKEIKASSKEEDKMESMNNELAAMEKKISEASLGVEHLLREVGEIYAAAHKTQNKELKLLLDKLPEVAAKLLLKGEPIELMDGDAPNVPLPWVKAVFSSLTNIVGEKTLFVISVLGIQRSGKSTMLNSMFGVQFPVSAGRCTRAAYMQLLKVDKMRSNLPYDFVLIIDTEGFNAVELRELKHKNDNQLATFVIGLGDVTILNIMGEDVAEISDVLQTTVLSFIKMKFSKNNFRTHRTCRFIHQNVPDLSAKLQLRQGSQALQEHLDKITAEVCNSEKVKGIQKFRDIIRFDSDSDVWYFPDLWYGDPPMAPANPGYAAKSQEVRELLLYGLPQKGGTFLTFPDLSLQVEDLWKGISSENFVFHFQNSLEAKAYDSLERTYQEKLSRLRNTIKERLTQVAAVEFEQCTTKEELDTQYSKLIAHLKKLGSEESEKACEEFEQFFASHNLRDILIKWKAEKTTGLRNEINEFLDRSEKGLLEQKETVGQKLSQKNEDAATIDQIMKKIKDFADEMKSKTVDDDHSWEDEFDHIWEKCIAGLKTLSSTIKAAAYNLFMNIINQNSEEVIAADLLVDHMEELVKQSVRKGMPNKIVDEIVSYFRFQKSKLLIRILKDLADGGFDDYKPFIEDSKSFGLEWITSFTNKRIFVDNGSASSKYGILAGEDIKRLVQSIEDSIKASNEVVIKQDNPDIAVWVKEFCMTMNTLPVTESNLKSMRQHKVRDFRNFEDHLMKRLSDMEKSVNGIFKAETAESMQWEEKQPYQQIMSRLWGCEAQCPFCGEVCKRTDPKHVSPPTDYHQCIQHRPSGINGIHGKGTDILFISSCNFDVQSSRNFSFGSLTQCRHLTEKYHPYKEYKKFLPDWDIAPSANMESSKYWMWFVAKYKEELAGWYKLKAPDIPRAWHEISKQEAVDSLQVYGN